MDLYSGSEQRGFIPFHLGRDVSGQPLQVENQQEKANPSVLVVFRKKLGTISLLSARNKNNFSHFIKSSRWEHSVCRAPGRDGQVQFRKLGYRELTVCGARERNAGPRHCYF